MAIALSSKVNFLGFFQEKEFRIEKELLLTTLPSLGPKYSISFKLAVSTFASGRQNVLHLTTGGNFGELGHRIPAVFLFSNKDFQIFSAVNDNYNHLYRKESLDLIEQKWIQINIRQIVRDKRVVMYD